MRSIFREGAHSSCYEVSAFNTQFVEKVERAPSRNP
jgi:hypothetical protein